ncbi:MAG TPA: ribulose-phosphate 3-epimerase [Candidatus Nanoarchaeia archaeon]|nr:ribulose-phosphate 3-epimerase [Candidatus Nanoarchaeia archaeon]
MKIKIAPSILSADLNNISQELSEVEPYADLIHIDIMDGKFVPSKTFTPSQIKSFKISKPMDVHLMVERPIADGYIKEYAAIGAASITIHAECKEDITECFKLMENLGVRKSISIKPTTPLAAIKDYLDDVDMVLIMSVEPGYSGQKFMSEVLPKIKELRKLKPKLDIEIDGGLNIRTVKKAVNAGANIIVAASYVFGSKDRKKAITSLRAPIH